MSLIQVAKSGSLHKGFVRLDASEQPFPNIQKRDHFTRFGKNAPEARREVEGAIALALYHQDHHAYIHCMQPNDTILHVHYVEGWVIDIIQEGITNPGRVRFAIDTNPVFQDKAWIGMIWRAMAMARKEYGGVTGLTPQSLEREVIMRGQNYHQDTTFQMGIEATEE